MLRICGLVAGVMVSFGAWAGVTCNVMDHGAVGDGTTKDTVAIQSTIDQCPSGGTVVLPSGKTFLSGTIQLKSNLTFQVQMGSTLRGSPDTVDYGNLVPKKNGVPLKNSQLGNCQKALIYAVGVQNLVIDGGQTLDPTQSNVNSGNSGTIDGHGDNNPNWNGSEATRPMAIFMALSSNVRIQHIQVINSGMWSVVNMENTGVVIDSVKVDSPSGPTRDGIDIVDCSNVTVRNVWVNSEDDSICLKSGSATGVHQVTVQNSVVVNSGVANALKLGTASSGSFDGIRFVGIHIQAAKQAAMAVESVDGAVIHGVTFKDIQFSNVGSAVFVLLGQRNGAPKVGSINNVFFQNISGSTNLNWGSVIAGAVVGGTRFPVTGVSFANVQIKNTTAGGLTAVPANAQEYAGGYPDPRLYGPPPLSAYGFLIRHADGVTFQNSSITGGPGDPRQAFVTTDVTGFSGGSN